MGYRSGKQINRDVASRAYKYTDQDCDLIVGIETNTGVCYIIPIDDIRIYKNSTSLKNLQKYKENWSILIELAKKI